MGALFTKLDDKMPQLYSYAEYEKIVNEVNLISIQISKHTNFILTVEVLSLQFDYSNWKNSLIKASLGVFPQILFKSRLFEEEEKMEKQPQYSFKHTFNLIVTIRQLYNIFDLLKFFKKQNTAQRNTLTKTPLMQQGKCCQICFDEIADLALPCGHIFGAKCISKYIIDKEQKACPMCRRQFIGRRSAIEKDLYFVIVEDESIFSEVKACLFEILKKRNENTIRNVLDALNIKNKPQI